MIPGQAFWLYGDAGEKGQERCVLPSQMKLEGVAFLIEVTHGQHCSCFDEDGGEFSVLRSPKITT